MSKILIGFIIVAVLSVGGFFLYHPAPTGIVIKDNGSPSANINTITIQAERFQYTPNVIHVKKGEQVKIIVDNTDTTHGIVIPDLGVSGIDSVEFTADKVGTYAFKCPTFCGEGHKTMTGTLIIDP